MSLKMIELVGRALRKAGNEVLRRNGIGGTWVDVGAHNGEETLGHAWLNPGLKVYAFEPNLRAAVTMIGQAANFIVLPIAISETDGSADFHINAFDAASSLLALNDDGVRSWEAAGVLKVESVVTVPTIRLDTFMNLVGLKEIDFLKVDSQGMDLAVIRSAGRRLQDIKKIKLEVWVSAEPLYCGAPRKEEVVSYLNERGFDLAATETQSEGHEENLTFKRR
jgi:FkbM family methyltransferase